MNQGKTRLPPRREDVTKNAHVWLAESRRPFYRRLGVWATWKTLWRTRGLSAD
jgi:hypothetical protein